MSVLGIIPARFASSRFPGKPLVDIGGKPMIQHVYERAVLGLGEAQVYVATDDERIAAAVESFGGKVIMTSTDHPNGSSRCAEALQKLGRANEPLINIQGDEPLLDPAHLKLIAALLSDPEVKIASLACPMTDPELINSPSNVKVIRDRKGDAMYFSRAVIPYSGSTENGSTLKHIGLYGFQTGILSELQGLDETPLSKAESLEQLSWMEHGYRIRIGLVERIGGISIDTPEDLEMLKERFI